MIKIEIWVGRCESETPSQSNWIGYGNSPPRRMRAYMRKSGGGSKVQAKEWGFGQECAISFWSMEDEVKNKHDVLKLKDQVVERGISEDSASAATSVALVIEWEGGQMGEFPCFFGFLFAVSFFVASVLVCCSSTLVVLDGIVFPWSIALVVSFRG